MKTVVLVGQLTDLSGYGHGARSYFSSLLDLDRRGLIELKLLNISFESVVYADKKLEKDYNEKLIASYNIGTSPGYKIVDDTFLNEVSTDNKKYSVVFFLTNNTLTNFMSSKYESTDQLNPIFSILKNAEEIYPCVVWETDKPPSSWLAGYRLHEDKINKLICACDWNKEQFSKHTNFETIKVPYTISNKLAVDKGFINEQLSGLKNKFNFVTVGQWGNRKGFDKLIKAFLLEFRDDKDVNLIIKSYRNAAFQPNVSEREFFKDEIEKIKDQVKMYGQQIRSDAKIIIITELLSPEQINSLYHISDCYVTTTRGEGFCYPIAEYSWFGKPIISPSKGGHTDLLPAGSPMIDYVDCSINSTRNKMRTIYNLKMNNPDGYDKLGKEHLSHIKQYLNHERITSLFEEALR
jgi:glycosyltransferase involved in cell wall biosynthesis